MQTTASGNINNKLSWSGIQKHLQHDENLNHSNAFLNTDESKHLRKYNRHVELINIDNFIKEKYGNYIIEHDKKALKMGKFLYVTPKDFLERDANGHQRKKTADKLFIEKFSNYDDWQNVLKDAKNELKDEQIYSIMSHAITAYAKGFNKRNSNVKMFEFYSHLDEDGTPHLHSRIMAYTPPAKGKIKPSWSLNKALKIQFHGKDSRVNYARFRKQEDLAMIDAVNKQLEKEAPEFAKTHHFELVRKTEQDSHIMTGREHDVYVKAQKKIDRANKQAKHAEDTAKRLVEQENDKFRQIKTFDKRKKELDDKEEALNTREVNLNTRESIIHSKEINVRNREKTVSERENAVNKREENARIIEQQNIQKRQQLDEKTALLNQQIVEVNTLKKSLSELYTKAKNLFSRLSYKFVDWLNSRNEKTLYNDAHEQFSLMEQYNKNGGFDVGGDSSLRDSLKKQGKDENNDGIDDTKEMNFHNLP